MKSNNVVTDKVRLAFPKLAEPNDSYRGHNPRYSVTILIPKDEKEALANIKKSMQEAALSAKDDKFGGTIPDNLRLPVKDGDKDIDTSKYPSFAGCYFIKAVSKTQPDVVDVNAEPITDLQTVKSGDMGRVSINFYAYNAAGNAGISAGLEGVQKISDRKPPASKQRSAKEVFGVWAEI